MTERPNSLGKAYFYCDGVVDIAPYRNHRDWLLDHAKEIGLPEYIHEQPSKALFESYKLGWLRIVWDETGDWSQARHKVNFGHERALYVNGTEPDIWAKLAAITNSKIWAGKIDLLVIEYLDIIDEKPHWTRNEFYRLSELGYVRFDELYKGRRPKRQIAPSNAIWGGDMPKSYGANKQRNVDNDN